MIEPVRIGVLGCASIAWRRMLPAMSAVPEIDVIAVASRDLSKAESFAARFDCAAVPGYERLLEREDVDAVYLPLPAGLRADWVRRALDAGKHVFGEKPLTTSARSAAELVELAREKRLLLRENFMFVHHGQHAAVRELVRDGRIGELRSFTAVFGIPPREPGDIRYQPELGGGALLDVGVYPLRAAQFFLPGELAVLGAGLREDSGVDVAGSVLLGAERGVTAQLGFGFEHHYRNTYELWGSSGRITLDRVFTPPAEMAPVIRIETGGGVEEIPLPPDDQFRNSATAFALDVSSGADIDAPDAAGAVHPGEDTVRLAALVDSVRRTAQTTA
ncbi:Gfo/Idh/MocA family oxidoreductase [Saccharopolyspora shandongensis]|uniref:Gfo/Idh/MocA family protein n=1 Tax=Saccharopolyspora shandongensis TaxID=418495 RepID=UPI0033C01C16